MAESDAADSYAKGKARKITIAAIYYLDVCHEKVVKLIIINAI